MRKQFLLRGLASVTVAMLLAATPCLAAGHGGGGGGGGGGGSMHGGGGGGGGSMHSSGGFSSGHSFSGSAGNFSSGRSNVGGFTPHTTFSMPHGNTSQFQHNFGNSAQFQHNLGNSSQFQHNFNNSLGVTGHNFGLGVHEQDWRHTQPWASNWAHGDAWHNWSGWGHGRWDNPFVVFPYGYAGWFGLYNWPYYYGYGDYEYCPVYYNADSASPLYSGAVNYAEAPQAASQPAATEGAASDGEQYFQEARALFLNGDYRGALRLANHAAVEMPQSPAVHELMSLSMFALKDYRGAAMEAHAALALGPPIDWATLYAYYGNADTYTEQLRALETFVQSNPKAPEGRFLLASHYLMTGNKDAAKKQLTELVALAPQDKLAEQLLKQL